MAVITTGSHPKALWPGVHAFFGQSYNKHMKEHLDIFDVKDSEKAYEEDVLTTGFGLAPVKPQAQSTSYDTDSQGFTKRYTHVAYGLGYVVSHEEIKDNLYKDKAFKRTEQLAFSFYTTKQIVAANVYNRAFSSSYAGGDGVALLSASHPTRSGNQSNIIATAADLSEASLEDLCIQIMQAKNDRGLQINLMAQSLHVAPGEFFNAERILKSALRVDTANNDINALKATGMIPKGVMVNHFFTDSDAYFIRTNCPDGMTMFEREALDFAQDNDFDTKNAKAAGYERYSVGWSDWRGLFGSAGS